MKWIDIPPVWLGLFIGMTWGWGQVQPDALSFGGAIVVALGTALVGVGLALIALAIFELQRQRTTVIPHMEAAHLVTSGVFARTRNPIYLGDALVLAGLAMRWDTLIALVLVPIFIWVINTRFIEDEEKRLAAKFGDAFAQYCLKTRRWL